MAAGERDAETLPVQEEHTQEALETPTDKRPVAVTSASRTSGPSSGFIVNYDASGSYDPDGGRIVSYAWSFGGGGVRASHEFVSDTAPRTFTVSVIVTDDEGESGTASVQVSAN